MTAKIIPFPSSAIVRAVPIDAEREYQPPGVRALLAIMEATERKYGSIMPPKDVSPEQHIRDVAPHLLQPA
jgi:hypothetical protein